MNNQDQLELALGKIRDLLTKRVSVVSDRALLEQDAQEHLRQLQSISEQLLETHSRLSPILPPRLDHFLANGSYAKALSDIQKRLQ